MARILVISGSSRTGRELISQGMERGHSMTAFVRDLGKVSAMPAAVTKVAGDALDAKAVADAITGHDAVMIAIGDRKTFVSAATVRNAIAGMKAAGVKRIVVLSAYGTGDSAHGLYGFMIKRMGGKLNADKTEAERLLSESGLDWVSVRAPVLSEGRRTGRFKAATGVAINAFRRLSRADLAAFMLDQVEGDAFLRQRPVIAAG